MLNFLYVMRFSILIKNYLFVGVTRYVGGSRGEEKLTDGHSNIDLKWSKIYLPQKEYIVHLGGRKNKRRRNEVRCVNGEVPLMFLKMQVFKLYRYKESRGYILYWSVNIVQNFECVRGLLESLEQCGSYLAW